MVDEVHPVVTRSVSRDWHGGIKKGRLNDGTWLGKLYRLSALPSAGMDEVQIPIYPTNTCDQPSPLSSHSHREWPSCYASPLLWLPSFAAAAYKRGDYVRAAEHARQRRGKGSGEAEVGAR